jgi:hypothetical protein
MNQDTLTRLGWVIEAVGKAPPRQFNMDYWLHRRWFCGTSHCAIGWACQDERVQASGLHLAGACGFLSMPRFDGQTGFDAIAKWLDIPKTDVKQLFGPRHRSGKSKEEVLERLYAYRDLVRYELARQAPQLQPEQQKEGAVSVAEQNGRTLEEQSAQTQQAHPAPSAAPVEQALQAPLNVSTSEVEPCES